MIRAEQIWDISIHALREEGDARHGVPTHSARYFYPRPPRGGRPSKGLRPISSSDISIHALREEGDPVRCFIKANLQFLSTPSARRATSTMV